MLNPTRDYNEGTYRAEGTTPATTACPEDRRGQKLLRVELKSKRDHKDNKIHK